MGGIATSPLHSRGPNKGINSKLAASSLSSWGDTSVQSYYVTPAFLAVPHKGDKIKIGYFNPAFSGAHKWPESQQHPCIPGSRQQRGENQNWLFPTFAFSGAHRWPEYLRHPCIPGGLEQRGPNQNRLPSWGAHNWEMQCNPCLLGGPQQGRKSEWAASTLLSRRARN